MSEIVFVYCCFLCPLSASELQYNLHHIIYDINCCVLQSLMQSAGNDEEDIETYVYGYIGNTALSRHE